MSLKFDDAIYNLTPWLICKYLTLVPEQTKEQQRGRAFISVTIASIIGRSSLYFLSSMSFTPELPQS